MISKAAILSILIAMSLFLNMVILMRSERRRAKVCARGREIVQESGRGIGNHKKFNGDEHILITGAAGFIGMHTALRLVLSQQLGGAGLSSANVVGLDTFDDYYSVQLKRARAAELLWAGVIVWEGSVCDRDLLGELFRQHNFSHVIHLAADQESRKGRWRPEKYDSGNVDCFDSLAESVIRFSPRAHLIFASTSSVYGESSRTPFSEYDRVDVPSNLDGVTKRTNELLAFAFYTNSGLHSTGLRFFTVYGEWGRPDMAVYTFSHAIDNDIPITLHGAGSMSRDFIYIGDVVDGIILASQYRAPPEVLVGLPSSGVPRPEIFNLGSGRPVKVTELIRMLEVRLNGTAIVEEDSGPIWDELESTQADISKAASVLGWRPRTTLEEGVGRFATWYQANASDRPEFYTEGRFQREGGASPSKLPHWDIPLPAQQGLSQLPSYWRNDSWGGVRASNRGDGEALRRRAAGAPVIAVITGTTSRNLSIKSVQDHPLLTLMIQSLLGTVEDGYEYWVYVGYDAGDAMFEDPAARANVSRVFEQRAKSELGKRGIVVQLAFVRVSNPLCKPGPVFNFVSAAAYDDGADYFFRVNDDTEFTTTWARKLVKVLGSFTPPNLGVVGARCDQGNRYILTFDFTHRTHREIFGVHYPPALTDWWLDDWISAVYPKSNVLRVMDVQVRHITTSHGRKQPMRYAVDRSNVKVVGGLVREGRTMVSHYLSSRILGECELMRDGRRAEGAAFSNMRSVIKAIDNVNSAAVEPQPSSAGRGKKPPSVPEGTSGLPSASALQPQKLSDGRRTAEKGRDVLKPADKPDSVKPVEKPDGAPAEPSQAPAAPAAPAQADKKLALSQASSAAQAVAEAVRASQNNTAGVEAAQRIASASTYPHPWVVVMLVNSGILDMALNWACNLGNRGLQGVLQSTIFLTVDDDAHAALSGLGHTAIRIAVPGGDWGEGQVYGSSRFSALVHVRQRFVLELLENDLSVLVAEPDATWYADLIDFVESAEEMRRADAISYNDAARPGPKNGFPCGGLLFLRATPSALALMRAINSRHRQGLLQSRGTIPEQQLLRQFWKAVKGEFVLLPVDKFANGKWYQDESAVADGLIYVHANYMMGIEKKVGAMRARKQWFLGQDNDCQLDAVQ